MRTIKTVLGAAVWEQRIYIRPTSFREFTHCPGKIIFSLKDQNCFLQPEIENVMQIAACFSNFEPTFVEFGYKMKLYAIVCKGAYCFLGIIFSYFIQGIIFKGRESNFFPFRLAPKYSPKIFSTKGPPLCNHFQKLAVFIYCNIS